MYPYVINQGFCCYQRNINKDTNSEEGEAASNCGHQTRYHQEIWELRDRADCGAGKKNVTTDGESSVHGLVLEERTGQALEQ